VSTAQAVTARPTHGDAFPRRIVALGGGTGMPAVLRGLRRFVDAGHVEALTAIVTMTDDGGSSGRLRRDRGVPPPGDVRNCIVALSAEEELLKGVFQHRYDGSDELGGHTLGNLMLAALAEQTGSFLRAVEVSSRVLRTVGTILPSTLDDVALEATFEDGSRVVGESRVAAVGKRILRVELRPRDAQPTPGILDALQQADLIVLGPGSLYTSILPNVIVNGVGSALRQSGAVVVLVANFVGERGEVVGLDVAGHVRVLEEHAGGRFLDGVLLHEGALPEQVLERYREEGMALLSQGESLDPQLQVLKLRLAAVGTKLRHDPDATARGVIDLWAAVRRVTERVAGR